MLPESRISKVASALSYTLLGCIVVGVTACKSSGGDATPAPAPEPPRFNFAVPLAYTPVELSGEGSETLRAPPGARVTRVEAGVRVEAGPDFAIEIGTHAKPLAELATPIEAARRRVDESDLIVFDVASGYAFVSVRELVPEWDENDRRRFSCSSAGVGAAPSLGGADVRGFSKTAVQDMVAACRTLELPRLE